MTEEVIPVSGAVTESVTNSNSSAQESVAPSTTETSFDVSRYFGDDLKSDPDFERLSKSIPTDPAKIIKDLYHKTKFFGKAREQVRKEIEEENAANVKTFKEEDYTYQPPEGVELNQDLYASAKAKALELGIAPDKFSSFYDSVLKREIELSTKAKEESELSHQKALDDLKKEWGSRFEERMARANERWQFFTGTEDDSLLDNLDANGKVALTKIMDKIAEKISDPVIGKVNRVAPDEITADNFRQKLADLEANNAIPPREKARMKTELYNKRYSSDEVAREFGINIGRL